jgi:hypothetical protein
MKVPGFGALLRSSGASTGGARRRRSSGAAGAAEKFEPDFEPDPTSDFASDPSRWQTVTILAQPHRLAPDGRLPAPLAELADLIETRLEPAPGERGTELSARTRPGPKPDSAAQDSAGWKGGDPARQIRSALQRARQLIEVGEVLAVEPQPAGKRRRPARGLLVDLMTGDADQEGVV